MTSKRHIKKKWPIIILSIILTAILLAYLLFSPTAGSNIPEIIRELPQGTSYDFSEARKVFAERVQSKFPINSKEDILIEELNRQGFRISRDSKIAYFHQSNFPCRKSWTIGWEADNKMLIKKIYTSYVFDCI